MKSERLMYMPLTKSYAKDLYKLCSNPKVVKYMFCPLKKTIEECNEWIGELLSNWDEPNVFVAKYNNVIIGIGGIPCWDKDKGEYGLYYQISEEYWKMGFGVEIAEALIEYAFVKCHAQKIGTYVITENKSSIKILEKMRMNLSFTRIGEFEKDGNVYDEHNYTITKEEWSFKYK